MAPVPITASSIPRMVDKFYARVREDPMLSPIFESQLGGRWDEHMPRMYAFWTKALLGSGDFQSNVFGKHMALAGLQSAHFIRWLALFRMTAIEVFGSEDAKIPILMAERIAASLHLGYFGKALT